MFVACDPPMRRRREKKEDLILSKIVFSAKGFDTSWLLLLVALPSVTRLGDSFLNGLATFD